MQGIKNKQTKKKTELSGFNYQVKTKFFIQHNFMDKSVT